MVFHRPSSLYPCVLYLSLYFSLATSAIIFPNKTFLHLDGLAPMFDKTAIVYTRDFLEKPAHISRTVPDRHRRQVIAGPWYQWGSNIIPFQIWGGDRQSYFFPFFTADHNLFSLSEAFQQLVRNGLRMWEETTCLRFQESRGSLQHGIRYVLETGDA